MRLVFLFSSIAVLAAPRCSAQVRGTMELSPVLGIYLPNGRLPAEPPRAVCIRGAPCNANTEDLQPRPREEHLSLAFGGRVTAWVNNRIAVDGSLWYTPGSVTGSTTGERASIVASSMRVLLSTRGTGRWAYLVGGPAFVVRFGDAYATSTGTARFGGVVGVGAHLRVARSLALRAEVDDYLYSFQANQQHDFSMSVGLSLASRIGGATMP